MEGTVFFEPDAPPFSAPAPVVVKIGGSLTRQPERLLPVLEILAHARCPLVAVAGGGAFADEVRQAQRRFGLSEAAAHRMAILAMHQNAFLISSLAPGLVPLEQLADIQSNLASGKKAIWLPLVECENDCDLPQTWEATSDAIAVRLAERLDGMPAIFVKSRVPKTDMRDPRSLAEEDLIDPVSADYLVRSRLSFTILEAGDLAKLESLLGAREGVDAAPRA